MVKFMYMENNILYPFWAKNYENLICGFTLPFFGNQALTRQCITVGNSVGQNRKSLAAFLKIDPAEIFSPHQIHSDQIMEVTREHAGEGALDIDNALKSDACLTNENNILLIVTWADCVPVLLYDPLNKYCAAIHSGWRGTQQKIVIKTINSFKNKGIKTENLLAAVGPAIKGCCYKVSDIFLEYFKDCEADKYFIKKNDGLYFDLSKMVLDQLFSTGINKNNIDYSGHCTACCKDPAFFSCRKDGKDKFEGQAAFIGVFD